MPSILQLQRVATCGPYDPGAYLALCGALVASGKRDYAESMFQRWEHEDPGNSVIAYYRAALLQEKPIARAPDAYLVDEFDAFADSFDQVLAGLGYRVPEYFAGLLEQRLARDASRRVIDLGCGTGLCGLVAKPYAATLCGVDISPGMLERARALRVYDELVDSDIVVYLNRCDQRFDLLLAGDSLEYIGDLHPIFAGARRVLDTNALLLLSFELGDTDDGFELPSSGRFQHGQTYVETTLRNGGFEVDHLETRVLRHENKLPVLGLVVVARAM
jgi:predicted TPR repeat methyltransferase